MINLLSFPPFWKTRCHVVPAVSYTEKRLKLVTKYDMIGELTLFGCLQETMSLRHAVFARDML